MITSHNDQRIGHLIDLDFAKATPPREGAVKKGESKLANNEVILRNAFETPNKTGFGRVMIYVHKPRRSIFV